MATTRRIEDIVEALTQYHPQPDIAFVQRAYVYSAKVHAGQVRKSGEPYLIHPLEVAYLLAEMQLDEASIVTGLLHDTVEDTLATQQDIEEAFGAEVSALVDGVTKLSQIHFDTDAHKQAENFRKMLVAMAKDIRVILVKLADRLHNMRTLQHLSAHKQRQIAQETMDIYAPLANRLGVNWVKSELEDLSFAYLHPLEFQALHEKVATLTAERHLYVKEVVALLNADLQKDHIPCMVDGRPKHLYSIYRKMVTRQIEFEEVYDVIAFRVLVDTVSQCYEVLGHVHAMWHPIPGRFKDYIAMPKPNQYQSLHTSVIGPKGERIEVQIRTHEMHQIAEQGIAAHWEYKEKSGLQSKSKQQFAWLRQLLEWQQDLKDPNEFLDTIKVDLFVDEVFVFTPRGEVIALKRGSTPVDFAFAIHTQVGLHCSGAKINGRIVPLKHVLRNGDTVEILTNPQQNPSKDWLNFVVTGRAKSKIRAFVQQEERARSKEVGRELLDRELRRHGKGLIRWLKTDSLLKLVEEGRYGSIESLFVAIGYGRISANQVVQKLFSYTPVGDESLALPAVASIPSTATAEKFQQTEQRKFSSAGVLVQGIEDVLVRYGKCCNPLVGDPIVGFVTRGRGITVHVSSCSRAIDSDPERRLVVSWDPQGTFRRPVVIRVVTTDKPGILANLSQTFFGAQVNIVQANCKVMETGRAINTFEVMIKDAEQLRKVLQQIRSCDGVISVDRL